MVPGNKILTRLLCYNRFDNKETVLTGKNNRAATLILLAVALAGALASGRILWKRMSFEKAAGTVQIAVDLPSFYAVAPPGTDINALIEKLKNAGVGAFGVFEYKSKQLVESGLISFEYPIAGANRGNLNGISLRLDAARAVPELISNWKPFLNTYFGPGTCDDNDFVCTIPAVEKSKFDEISFGLEATPKDLHIVPRLFNSPFENKATIRKKISSISDSGKQTVIIFDGDSVLGYPDLTDVVAAAINERGNLDFGMIEITKQDGAHKLAEKLPGRVIPVHSIPSDELAKTPEDEAVSRFRRAVRERGIKMVYVRPYTTLYGLSPEEALERNIEYIEEIAAGIRADGFEIGDVEPMGPFIISQFLRAICLAGAAAFVWLLASAVLKMPAFPGIALAFITFLMGVYLPSGEGKLSIDFLAKLAALGTACTVPALSVSLFFLGRQEGGRACGFGENAVKWVGACAVTIAGAVFIAAMLSQRSFFLRLDQFVGIKLSFLLPLLIVFVVYMIKTDMRFSEFLATPLKYSEVIAGLVLLAALALYILRSGNDAAGAVSGIEVHLRATLENLLQVRPRTKEFLIGHPALLIAGLFPASKKNFFPLLVLFAGLICQISIINSFCHLHTPVAITWTRTTVGMLLGFGTGACLRAVIPLLKKIFTFSG